MRNVRWIRVLTSLRAVLRYSEQRVPLSFAPHITHFIHLHHLLHPLDQTEMIKLITERWLSHLNSFIHCEWYVCSIALGGFSIHSPKVLRTYGVHTPFMYVNSNQILGTTHTDSFWKSDMAWWGLGRISTEYSVHTYVQYVGFYVACETALDDYMDVWECECECGYEWSVSTTIPFLMLILILIPPSSTYVWYGVSLFAYYTHIHTMLDETMFHTLWD